MANNPLDNPNEFEVSKDRKIPNLSNPGGSKAKPQDIPGVTPPFIPESIPAESLPPETQPITQSSGIPSEILPDVPGQSADAINAQAEGYTANNDLTTVNQELPVTDTPVANPQPQQQQQPPVTDVPIEQQQQPLPEPPQDPNAVDPFQLPPINHTPTYGELTGVNISAGFDPTAAQRAQIQLQNSQFTPEHMLNRALSLGIYNPQEYSNLLVDQDRVSQRFDQIRENLKEQQARYTDPNDLGFKQENYVYYQGNWMPKTDYLSQNLNTDGVSSELGKIAQDAKDPTRENNIIGGIKNFLFGDLSNLGRKGTTFLDAIIPEWTPGKDQALDNVAKMLGYESGEDFRKNAPQDIQQNSRGNKFNPLTGQYGNYGNYGGLSGGIYALDLGGSLLTSAIYDLADLGRELAGSKEIYNGNRTIDALTKGTGLSFANRWTEREYLAIQEPENLKPGEKTGNLWWDLPETLVDTVREVRENIGLGSLNDSVSKDWEYKLAHWTIQAPVAATVDIVTGNVADTAINITRKGVEKGLTNIVKNTTPRASGQVADIAESVDNVSKVTDDAAQTLAKNTEAPPVKPVPESKIIRNQVDDVSSTIIKNEIPVKASVEVKPEGIQIRTDTVTYQIKGSLIPTEVTPSVIQAKPIETIIPNIDRPKLLNSNAPVPIDQSALLTVNRTDLELTRVGQSLGIVDPYRALPLSSNELGALERIMPNELSRVGSYLDADSLTKADVFSLPDGSLVTTPRTSFLYDTTDELLGVNRSSNYDTILNRVSRLEDELINTALSESKPTADTVQKLIDNISLARTQKAVKVAQMLDDGTAYTMMSKHLPRDLRGVTTEQKFIGNQLIQSTFEAENLSITKQRLANEAEELGKQIRDIRTQKQVFPPIGRRDDLQTSLDTYLWSGGRDPIGDTSPRQLDQIIEGVEPPLNTTPADIGSVTNDLRNQQQQLGRFITQQDELRASGIEIAEDTYQTLRQQFDQVSTELKVAESIDSDIKALVYNEPIQGLKHGTRLDTNVKLHTVDPLHGGSPSEFGLGIYLTTDDVIATSAANKFSVNQPIVSSDFNAPAHIRNVDISSVEASRIIDLKQSPNSAIRNVLEEATLEATANKNLAKQMRNGHKSIGHSFNEFASRYYQYYGTPPTELVKLKYQQAVGERLRSLGIAGGVFDNTVVIYDPSIIRESTHMVLPNPQNTIEGAYEAQRVLDLDTFNKLGDDVSRVNYLASKEALANRMLETNIREQVQIDTEILQHLEDIRTSEKELRESTLKQQKQMLDEMTEQSPKRVALDYKNPDNFDTNPCI